MVLKKQSKQSFSESNESSDDENGLNTVVHKVSSSNISSITCSTAKPKGARVKPTKGKSSAIGIVDSSVSSENS